jgi:hypothetical protein
MAIDGDTATKWLDFNKVTGCRSFFSLSVLRFHRPISANSDHSKSPCVASFVNSSGRSA